MGQLQDSATTKALRVVVYVGGTVTTALAANALWGPDCSTCRLMAER